MRGKHELETKNCYWLMPDYNGEKCTVFVDMTNNEEKNLPGSCKGDDKEMDEIKYIF